MDYATLRHAYPPLSFDQYANTPYWELNALRDNLPNLPGWTTSEEG